MPPDTASHTCIRTRGVTRHRPLEIHDQISERIELRGSDYASIPVFMSCSVDGLCRIVHAPPSANDTETGMPLQDVYLPMEAYCFMQHVRMLRIADHEYIDFCTLLPRPTDWSQYTLSAGPATTCTYTVDLENGPARGGNRDGGRSSSIGRHYGGEDHGFAARHPTSAPGHNVGWSTRLLHGDVSARGAGTTDSRHDYSSRKRTAGRETSPLRPDHREVDNQGKHRAPCGPGRYSIPRSQQEAADHHLSRRMANNTERALDFSRSHTDLRPMGRQQPAITYAHTSGAHAGASSARDGPEILDFPRSHTDVRPMGRQQPVNTYAHTSGAHAEASSARDGPKISVRIGDGLHTFNVSLLDPVSALLEMIAERFPPDAATPRLMIQIADFVYHAQSSGCTLFEAGCGPPGVVPTAFCRPDEPLGVIAQDEISGSSIISSTSPSMHLCCPLAFIFNASELVSSESYLDADVLARAAHLHDQGGAAAGHGMKLRHQCIMALTMGSATVLSFISTSPLHCHNRRTATRTHLSHHHGREASPALLVRGERDAWETGESLGIANRDRKTPPNCDIH